MKLVTLPNGALYKTLRDEDLLLRYEFGIKT